MFTHKYILAVYEEILTAVKSCGGAIKKFSNRDWSTLSICIEFFPICNEIRRFVGEKVHLFANDIV